LPYLRGAQRVNLFNALRRKNGIIIVIISDEYSLYLISLLVLIALRTKKDLLAFIRFPTSLKGVLVFRRKLES